MRDEYDFSQGVRGKFYHDYAKNDHAMEVSPQVCIQSYNPYEARFPARRVISREALHIAKLLRENGYSVIVEPDDDSRLNYITRKGLKEFLVDPIHLIIVGIPITVVVNILSTWLYQTFKKTPRTEELNIVLEVDDHGRRLRYNHQGEPLSENRFRSILRLIERQAQRFKDLQTIDPPDPTKPLPIFLEHTDKLVGWGRASLDEKGLRVDDVQIIHKKTLKRMKEGELKGLSIAGLIHDSRCSICDLQYVDCNHITGQLYDGQECLNRIDGILLAETSLVEKPVQPKAKIEGIKVKQKKRKKQPIKK